LFAPDRTDLDVGARVQLLTSRKTQEPTFGAALLLSNSGRAFMWADVRARLVNNEPDDLVAASKP
jgi:hypothetical protein